MTLSFPPPKNWQDFETLTKDVARFKLSGDFDNYGRPGQAQGGLDVFGWDIDGKSTGIQCKHKGSSRANSTKIITSIKKAVIDKELASADTFHPKLDVFIIATTSFRDTALQDHINLLNDQRKGKGLPKVILWTWETYEDEINRHSHLQYFYYENILIAFDQYNKDKHILSLLRYALDRPAFNTEFHVENHCEEFLKAITDTQQAFTTGKLNDRNGHPISSSYPSKDLSSSADKTNVQTAQGLLQDIRDFVTEQLRAGNIIQANSFLEFRHNSELGITGYLNKTRAAILTLINKALTANNMEKIKSKLIIE